MLDKKLYFNQTMMELLPYKTVKQIDGNIRYCKVGVELGLKSLLSIFEAKYPSESSIISYAIETLQKWMNGEMKMWDARKYTYTVLALAREIEKNDKTFAQIVRATSHCLATCHVPTHFEGVAMYTVSFLKHFYKNKENVFAIMEEERKWQIEHLKLLMKGVSK